MIAGLGLDWSEKIPELRGAWLFYLTIALVVLAGEWGWRQVLALHLSEPPVLYSIRHMDDKRLVFEEHFLPMDEPGTRFLVLGSSIAQTNIDPGKVRRELEAATGEPWSGFNGALFGIRYEDMLFFANWYHDRWEFDHLVVLLEPWSVRAGRMPNLQERLRKPAIERWLMHNSALFAIRNQFVPYDHNEGPEARGIFALDHSGSTIRGFVRTLYKHAVAPENHESNAREQAGTMLDSRHDPPVPFEPTTDLVIALREWAAGRGITVWWVIPPYRPILEQYLPEQYQYEAWREYAGEVAAPPGNHLIDMKHLEGHERLTGDAFWDGTHMAPHGAAFFSGRLGREWADRLAREGYLAE